MKLWLTVCYLLTSLALFYSGFLLFLGRASYMAGSYTDPIIDYYYLLTDFGPMVLGIIYIFFAYDILKINKIINISLAVLYGDIIVYFYIGSFEHGSTNVFINYFLSWPLVMVTSSFLYTIILPVFEVVIILAIVGLIISLKEKFFTKELIIKIRGR